MSEPAEPNVRRSAATAALADAPADSGAERIVRSLVDMVGREGIRSILLFGSRMVQASPDRFSAYDLVVVVESYRDFFHALARAKASRRAPSVQAALAPLLAPSVIAFAPEDWEQGPVAKIMVLQPAALERALSARARDHFVKGRLVQKVALLHARDAAAAEWVSWLLEDARRDILAWAGPFLPASFTPAQAALRMLQVSYAGEVRPEAADRVLDVFEAQRAFLEAMLARVIEGAVATGTLVREGAVHRFACALRARDRRRMRLYFLRSKARATARWLKHVVTFDNWLDYIARKVERRTGMRVEITPMERRFPYLLLWPKVAQVLRDRPRGRLR